MCCTEVDGCNSSFGCDSCFAHNLAWFYPCGGIGNFTRRIQILDDIIVFQQFTRFVGCHDYLPGSGIISHYIHGAIHYRSQCILLVCGGKVFGQTPVVNISICQCGPFTIRPVPSASSLRLSALSDSRLFLYPLRSSRPPALTFLSAPPATCLPALRLSAHSCLSAPSAPSRPPAPPANFIPPISHSALFFRRRMFFSHPISDTLLKSRRGELGISDNN